MGMQLTFNAAQVEPARALDPIPAGWYNFTITKSEEKPTSQGDGSYLQIELIVMDGPYKGRKCYDRFNLNNKNPMTVEIAYKQLSAICHAIGVMQISDSAMLHNRPLQGKVSLKPASTGADGKPYEANNEMKGYKAIEQQTATQFAAPPMPAMQAPAYAPVSTVVEQMPTWATAAPPQPQAQVQAAQVQTTLTEAAPPWQAQGQAAPTPPWAK